MGGKGVWVRVHTCVLQDLASHLVKTFTADVKYHALLLSSGIVAGVRVRCASDRRSERDACAAMISVFSCIGRARTEINDRMRQRLMLMYARARGSSTAMTAAVVLYFCCCLLTHVQAASAGIQRGREGRVCGGQYHAAGDCLLRLT